MQYRGCFSRDGQFFGNPKRNEITETCEKSLFCTFEGKRANIATEAEVLDGTLIELQWIFQLFTCVRPRGAKGFSTPD